MRTTLLLAIVVIGMMTSCIQEKTKYVIAKRIEGDTLTLQRIRVFRDYQVGEVVFGLNGAREGSNKFKIVRECRN
jgi:hypothetical protein